MTGPKEKPSLTTGENDGYHKDSGRPQEASRLCRKRGHGAGAQRRRARVGAGRPCAREIHESLA